MKFQKQTTKRNLVCSTTFISLYFSFEAASEILKVGNTHESTKNSRRRVNLFTFVEKMAKPTKPIYIFQLRTNRLQLFKINPTSNIPPLVHR